MIDGHTLIAQVMQKKYPSGCQVYHGTYRQGCLYFWRVARTTTLVLLPQGIIQWDSDWDSNNEEKFWQLDFGYIQDIQLCGETRFVVYDGDGYTTNYYWLDVYLNDGSYLKWSFGTAFSDAPSIGKSIIATYNHHWR